MSHSISIINENKEKIKVLQLRNERRRNRTSTGHKFITDLLDFGILGQQTSTRVQRDYLMIVSCALKSERLLHCVIVQSLHNGIVSRTLMHSADNLPKRPRRLRIPTKYNLHFRIKTILVVPLASIRVITFFFMLGSTVLTTQGSTRWKYRQK